MKFIRRFIIFILFLIIFTTGLVYAFYIHLKPDLPNISSLKNYEMQTPMQIYSSDGLLMAQFGEKRRIPLKFNQIPKQMVDAFIATEDSRFYDHIGIDPIGMARAAFVVLTTGHLKQGASTITQQVARNFFLTRKKSFLRKIKEIFIALHIEQLLTKKEILELYLNKIYLGYRAYGVGAAAKVYFGKDPKDLTLSEIAVIAGLPKAPSTLNPIYSLKIATERRNIVLDRMYKEKYITKNQMIEAKKEKIHAYYHTAKIQVYAPYISEYVRDWAIKKYGNSAYTDGLDIYTTVDSKVQQAAQKSVIDNLLNYDERHGYRGSNKKLWSNKEVNWTQNKIKNYLKKIPTYRPLIPAVVIGVKNKEIQVIAKNQKNSIVINWDGLKWARKFITNSYQGKYSKSAEEIVSKGQLIWIRKKDDVWRLSQVPNANSGLISMNPYTGAIEAMVGGFNFTQSKFNRMTQSLRQVGSSIKPFIYSAALDSGMTLATLVNDAPITKVDQWTSSVWRPKNDPEQYNGLTRLRRGLAQSKNVMAIRILRTVGINKTVNYLTRFGFDAKNLPKFEPLALGVASITPIKMVRGFSAFVNGGYLVKTYIVSKVVNSKAETIFKEIPVKICKDNCINDDLVDESSNKYLAKKIITTDNAFLVKEMLKSNIWGQGYGGDWWRGTGWRAKVLNRHDIGGKTGTTQSSTDAWYIGYGPNVVAATWIGFDNPKFQLGKHEAGGKTAQPAWISFMKFALANTPEDKNEEKPSDIVIERIDKKTGLLTSSTGNDSMNEYFIEGTEPKQYVSDEKQSYDNELLF